MVIINTSSFMDFVTVHNSDDLGTIITVGSISVK